MLVLPSESETRSVFIKVLEMARDMDVDSAVLIAGLADVCGHTAAVLDEKAGILYQTSIEKRLESFNDRAAQTYRRTRARMSKSQTVLN